MLSHLDLLLLNLKVHFKWGRCGYEG